MLQSEDLAISVALAGALAYLLSGWFSRVFPRHGLSGVDVHKASRPVTAEMGGAAVVIGALAGSSLMMILDDPVSLLFAAGLATIGLAAVVGAFDDVLGIRQRYKPFLIAACSAPLALALSGHGTVALPFIGSVDFGIAFPLLVVPLAVATSANFSNMLAGFNGLEGGVSALAVGTLAVLAAARGETDAAFLGAIFLAGLLCFMRFNWYPSRIFPGDTGTLAAGAAIAVIGLMGGLEFAAVVVSIPAALDFALKMLSRSPFSQRGKFGDSSVDADGHLIPSSYPALTHAMMRASPITERGLVSSIVLMEACYCALAAALTLLFL